MEFHVTVPGATPDPTAIANLVCAVDPAALVDLDPSSETLRVATTLHGDQLAALIRKAGYPVAPQQIVQLPSVCCGGCSG